MTTDRKPTHEERARKLANLINSQKFSGLLEDLLTAAFAEVEAEAYSVFKDNHYPGCPIARAKSEKP